MGRGVGLIIVGRGRGVFVGVTVTVGVGVFVGVFVGRMIVGFGLGVFVGFTVIVGVGVGVLVGLGCILRFCVSVIPFARPHPNIESFPEEPKSIAEEYNADFIVDGDICGFALHTNPNNAAMWGAAALVP